MRLIDADALEKDANEDLLSDTDTEEEVYWNDGAKSIIDLIKTAPTIDTVKRGKWVEHTEPEPWDRHQTWFWTCSECGAVGVDEFRYCPHCGARMDGEQ